MIVAAIALPVIVVLLVGVIDCVIDRLWRPRRVAGQAAPS